MIKTSSEQTAFQTVFSSERQQAMADAPIEKGGSGAGFDPHELLEAALATCINIVVRKRAAQLDIAIEGITTTVRLIRSIPGVATFEYGVEIRGSLTTEQHALLLGAVKTCPVSQTLSKQIAFREVDKALRDANENL